ncbi:hypothetical protein DOTSEDRAFT_71050 [Dothistroma septosporum NZE10]|uniref:Zn(2)-C6 fungal-type domain-containing protein n=1 Tax=Dothistroma septosporum (strain NZE10 / CBS 128990) TaxID=675120 RepID=N1PQH7_DOTSN|nr:hypothetical protein DOTSEDRAFT_71050 [Dothistroma septosporum NZE10]
MEPPRLTHQQASRLVPIAPAAQKAASGPQHSGQDVPLMPYTCVTCAKRKVKCDKSGPPCNTCRKAKLTDDCHYQEPAPRKRKRKPEEDLQDRVQRYEDLLKKHDLLPADIEDSTVISDIDRTPVANPFAPGGGPSASSLGKKAGGTLLKGPGKTRYIDSNIWRNLGEDLHPSSDEEDVDDQQESTPASAGPIDPVSAAFFGATTTKQSLIDLHPTYDVAMKLWSQYVRNIDPIIKLVHGPTTFELIQRVAANPSSMSKVNECLLFALYHFAIVSTPERDCEALFGQTWSSLRRKYHDSAKQALVAVHFLRTTELAVLQAYMLLLLSVRNQYDPHTFWILTGIAVRIAQRMGLHRDGEELGLNAFDVQMRRRVFWQLLPLDGLSGQLSGTGIAIPADSWDTKQPLNIDDKDIWPGMDSRPTAKKGATDMIFCLARTEIGRFHQKLRPALGNWAKLWETKESPAVFESLQDLENTMEEKYIRYCDISNPVHCLTIAMARAAVNSARLRIKVPKARADEATLEEKKELWTLACQVLLSSITVHQNPAMLRFNWHMKQFFQWDPLIWIINEARREAPAIDRASLWAKVEECYNSHPELLSNRRSIDVALGRLTLRSWDEAQAREATSIPDPLFITRLREAFGKREASRQNTETAIQQQEQAQNVFDPTLAWQDIPVENWLSANPAWGFSNDSFVNGLDGNVDWQFWDQLARQQPGGFGQA